MQYASFYFLPLFGSDVVFVVVFIKRTCNLTVFKKMSDISSISSLSSFEDEELDIPRPRLFRKREDAFLKYSDEEFRSRFRFTKVNVNFIIEIIGHNLERFTRRNKALTPGEQILITLRYFATGTFHKMVGDTANVDRSTVSKIIRCVSHHIALLRPNYIYLSNTPDKMNIIKQGFYDIAGFPGIVGAIDCTHIKIKSPGGDQAELYRNRKGYFSINVQAVCDSTLKVLNIVARWPGSTHDSTIFNDSALCAEFESGHFDRGYLLGDNGYPCRNYLLTPLLNPANPSQVAYNNSHKSTRNTVERCFGVVKKRFPCLYFGLRNKMETNLCIIVACFVLHNMAIAFNEPEPDGEDIEQEPIHPPLIEDRNTMTGQREALIRTIFAR